MVEIQSVYLSILKLFGKERVASWGGKYKICALKRYWAIYIQNQGHQKICHIQVHLMPFSIRIFILLFF